MLIAAPAFKAPCEALPCPFRNYPKTGEVCAKCKERLAYVCWVENNVCPGAVSKTGYSFMDECEKALFARQSTMEAIEELEKLFGRGKNR